MWCLDSLDDTVVCADSQEKAVESVLSYLWNDDADPEYPVLDENKLFAYLVYLSNR